MKNKIAFVKILVYKSASRLAVIDKLMEVLEELGDVYTVVTYAGYKVYLDELAEILQQNGMRLKLLPSVRSGCMAFVNRAMEATADYSIVINPQPLNNYVKKSDIVIYNDGVIEWER